MSSRRTTSIVFTVCVGELRDQVNSVGKSRPSKRRSSMTRLRFLQHRTARRLLAVVAVLALAFSLLASGAASASRPAGQPSARPVESRVNALLAKMTLQEKLEQIQLLPDFMVTDQEVPQRPRLGAERHGSVDDQQAPAHRGRSVPVTHPVAVRVRHDPWLPDDLPDSTGNGQQLRPAGGHGRRHGRRPRVGRSRAQAGLRPDGGRLARAAVGPDR